MAKIKNTRLKYFPVCGNISYQSLARRLKKLQLVENDSLLIQIGHIENP